jgi:hypothetical protein
MGKYWPLDQNSTVPIRFSLPWTGTPSWLLDPKSTVRPILNRDPTSTARSRSKGHDWSQWSGKHPIGQSHSITFLRTRSPHSVSSPTETHTRWRHDPSGRTSPETFNSSPPPPDAQSLIWSLRDARRKEKPREGKLPELSRWGRPIRGDGGSPGSRKVRRAIRAASLSDSTWLARGQLHREPATITDPNFSSPAARTPRWSCGRLSPAFSLCSR